MTALDVLFGLAAAVDFLAAVAPAWGALLVAVAVAAAWWRLRPTGRHRAPRTRVRDTVRTLADTRPDTTAGKALICADTCPDVSADHRPDASGHDGAGAR